MLETDEGGSRKTCRGGQQGGPARRGLGGAASAARTRLELGTVQLAVVAPMVTLVLGQRTTLGGLYATTYVPAVGLSVLAAGAAARAAREHAPRMFR